MKNVAVLAPHPDDETLGCCGTLLAHKRAGDAIHWIIATDFTVKGGFSEDRLAAREEEIAAVANAYDFASVHRLGFPTTRLADIERAALIERLRQSFHEIKPDVLYLPFPDDLHTDHRAAFEAAAAATKWFRSDIRTRLLAYETLSETEAAIDPGRAAFQPTWFVDIAGLVDEKIRILKLFKGEMGTFPFPRSAEAIRAQALLRGAQCGCAAAEAFVLLREVQVLD